MSDQPPVVPAVTPSRLATAPWWIPPWSAFLGVGLFAMTWWIMAILAPKDGDDPSQLFTMLAQAIVLTAFIGGAVAAVYTATRDSQKKTDTIAAQAQAIASQVAQPGGQP